MIELVLAAVLAAAAVVLAEAGPVRRLPEAAVPGTRRGMPERLGATLRERLGLPWASRHDGRIGATVLTVAVLVPVDPVLGSVGGVLAWLVPWWRERRCEAARRRAVDRGVSELVDLVLLGATAGLPVRGALDAALPLLEGPLAARLGRATADAARGQSLADALSQAAVDLGGASRPLLDALVAGERYGAPLVDPLRRVAEEARRLERLRAERAARRLPVVLLFPLVGCTLPAFALVTVVPVVASTIAALEG